jgi:hypothetical protein
MTNVSGGPPGSAIPPRYVRPLKIAVAIMTALLIAGIVALVYGIVRQVSKLGSASSKPSAAAVQPAPYTRVLDLGQGRLEAVTANGNLLVLHWKSEGGDVLLSLDPRNGNELWRIQLPRH